ncbi:major capsid protein [Microvirus mar40]|uniref:Major capsid protein n=1 Tax=Microvirus mar40 TaxID=2851175 RepID=A0A8F5XS17_9VIRU|nr:major capsid protein [Microvirus mar40]
MIIKNIGKNTLGDNSKMNVAMREYEMSTHDLSFVFRNTQSPGTLVPFMKLVAQKGDIFDIKLINKTLTHPTVGPLFGSYKLQHFIFTCPIRLYNSWLHNNRTNIGMNMSQIKFPVLGMLAKGHDEWKNPSNPSSLMAYLGYRGFNSRGVNGSFSMNINAIPYLAYWDIFKNYFANKQEKNAYYIGISNAIRYFTILTGTVYNTIPVGKQNTINVEVVKTSTIKAEGEVDNWEKFWENTMFSIRPAQGGSQIQVFTKALANPPYNSNTITLTKINDIAGEGTVFLTSIENQYQNGIKLKSFPLENIDKMRDTILQTSGNTALTVISAQGGTLRPYNEAIDVNKEDIPQFQLAVKTYDSDIFQNWVNTDWIEGTNGINEISAVQITDGKLTMDSLNLAQKVYNMLNRIAVSGGTYRDWLETVYTAGNYMERPETPVFEGGMTQFIEFDEVISNAATENEPLGTLAGRGRTTEQRGSGKLHFKIQEPSYIIGLIAITPQIDYSQGNEWDIMDLKTMDDLHKPALDGIGYQDSLNNQRAWWTAIQATANSYTDTAAGKTIAWINYMTNYNKTFGNFASGQPESFMCLNRNYEQGGEKGTEILDLSTYIDPSKHNEIFADTNLDAMNFWVQTACDIKVRRNISAKQIPNL